MDTSFWGGLTLPLSPQDSLDRDRHCIAGALGIPGGAEHQAEGDRT